MNPQDGEKTLIITMQPLVYSPIITWPVHERTRSLRWHRFKKRGQGRLSTQGVGRLRSSQQQHVFYSGRKGCAQKVNFPPHFKHKFSSLHTFWRYTALKHNWGGGQCEQVKYILRHLLKKKNLLPPVPMHLCSCSSWHSAPPVHPSSCSRFKLPPVHL